LNGVKRKMPAAKLPWFYLGSDRHANRVAIYFGAPSCSAKRSRQEDSKRGLGREENYLARRLAADLQGAGP
jgi:hypothetical protein